MQCVAKLQNSIRPKGGHRNASIPLWNCWISIKFSYARNWIVSIKVLFLLNLFKILKGDYNWKEGDSICVLWSCRSILYFYLFLGLFQNEWRANFGNHDRGCSCVSIRNQQHHWCIDHSKATHSKYPTKTTVQITQQPKMARSVHVSPVPANWLTSILNPRQRTHLHPFDKFRQNDIHSAH